MSHSKPCLVAAVILVMASSVFAAGPLSVGIKGGLALNNSNFNYSSTEFSYDPNNGMGLNLSLQVEHSLTPFTAVRVDAGYLQKGFDEDLRIVTQKGESQGITAVKSRINVLSLALLFKGQLPIGTYFVAGPRADFKLGVSHDMKMYYSEIITPGLKSTVYGLTVGAGQEFPLTALGVLFFEAQYLYDLSDEYSTSADPAEVGTLTSINNRAFAFLIGIRR